MNYRGVEKSTALRPFLEIALSFFLMAGSCYSAWGFSSSNAPGIGGGIVHQEMSRMLIWNRGFSPGAYNIIENGNVGQDSLTPNGLTKASNFGTPKYHFDDNKINEALANIESLRRGIADRLPTVACDPVQRKQTLESFGKILHAVQDFYAHANYLELYLRDRAVSSASAIPLADWGAIRAGRVAGLKTGFYTKAESFTPLATYLSQVLPLNFGRTVIANFKTYSEYQPFFSDWVGNKTFVNFQAALNNATSRYNEMHYYLNKDDPGTPQGRMVHPGTRQSLYQLAVNLATRETLRQWDDLERNIRQQYGNRADIIIKSLKENQNATSQECNQLSTGAAGGNSGGSGISATASGNTVPATTDRLRLSKSVVAPGERISITATPHRGGGSLSIALVPATAPHQGLVETGRVAMDTQEFDYHSYESLYVNAPAQSGRYEYRLFEGRNEIQAAPLTVSEPVADGGAGRNASATGMASTSRNSGASGLRLPGVNRVQEMLNKTNPFTGQFPANVAGISQGAWNQGASPQQGSSSAPASTPDQTVWIPTEAPPSSPPPVSPASQGSVLLQKSAFTPGERIDVRYTIDNSFQSDAWVGVIPSGVPHGSEEMNDQHHLTYEYLDVSRPQGIVYLAAPDQPGQYDIRLHRTDSGGGEAASVSFTVEAVSSAAPPRPTYIPSMAPPSSAQVALYLDRTAFSRREPIAVHFTAGSGYDSSAWIGIIPSHVPHGSEEINDEHHIRYEYLDGRHQGSLYIEAPDEPGTYDMRMHMRDDGGPEVGFVTFTVR